MPKSSIGGYLAAFVAGALLVLVAVFISPLPGIIGLVALLLIATSTADDRSMITSRGRWVLMAAVILAVTGVTHFAASTVALLGITLLAWFIFEWIRFAFRARFALTALKIERTIWQGSRVVTSGWSNQSFRVGCFIHNGGRWHCPLLDVLDVHSETASFERLTIALPPGGEATGEIILKPCQPGVILFAGFHLKLRDLNGFFQTELFMSRPATITVMPSLTDEEGRQRAEKRFNSLPPPGMHRLRMPGSGSELLDLRDYRPGDPPKMIAWKPSARRDRLITKEFESEVPVRCTLLLDCSNSVRIRTGGESPVVKLVMTAAGIMLAASANRDLIGVAFFDAKHSRITRPARTVSHVMRMLNELARTCSLLPEVPETDPLILLDRVEPAVRLRVPTLFDSFANARPWGFYWRPLLDTRWGWLIFIPFAFAPFLALQTGWLDFAARMARGAKPGTGLPFVEIPVFMAVLLIILLLPTFVATLFWMAFGLSGFLPVLRKSTRRRKQISAIFASMDADSPAAIERYLLDDFAFAERLGRFLAEEGLPIPVRRYDVDGADRFCEVEKVKQVSRTLIRAMSRARDNELYVILADLLDVTDSLHPLICAVKLACSRHHHVLVIVAWPEDIPIHGHKSDCGSHSIQDAVRRAVIDGTHRRYDKLRRVLTRSGAIVLRLADRGNIHTVLDELDRLRGARSRR